MAEPAQKPPESPGSNGPKKKQNGADPTAWGLLGLGLQLALTVTVFVLIGGWLDRTYGWTPWGQAGLGVLGLAAGLYHFVKETSK